MGMKKTSSEIVGLGKKYCKDHLLEVNSKDSMLYITCNPDCPLYSRNMCIQAETGHIVFEKEEFSVDEFVRDFNFMMKEIGAYDNQQSNGNPNS